MNYKSLIVLLLSLLYFSCDLNKSISKKETNQIANLKEKLAADYDNQKIRNKLINAYLQRAKTLLQENKIKEALKIIDKSLIYTKASETNTEISNILLNIGKDILTQSLSELKSENYLQFRYNEKFQKGIMLLDKAREYTDSKAQITKIMDNYYHSIALKFFENVKQNYQQDIVELNYPKLQKDLNNLNYIKKLDPKFNHQDFFKIKNDLVGKLLFYNDKTQLYSFKLNENKILWNRSTTLLGIQITFSNNEKSGYRAISPTQFTLFDNQGNSYRPLETYQVLEKSGYKGLLKRRRLDAGSTLKGLLVFQIPNSNLKFSKLKWVSSKNEIAEKLFPNKSIRKL